MAVDLWRAYDELGDDFRRRAEESPYNALYDRPNTLAALGAVEGLDLLDAACGPGVYAEQLIQDGAIVTAFDASSAMVALARARLTSSARVDEAQLDAPFPYPDGSFDRVLCALAIHHSTDRALTFREFHRVLKPGGRVVLSTSHPTVDWLRKGGSYFTVQQETDTWATRDGVVEVSWWREPLSALCSAAITAGFLIDLLHEPLPDPVMQNTAPDTYRKLSSRPDFLILGLRKVGIDH